MKYITYLLFSIFSSTLTAQEWRSEPPEPGPAPQIKIGDFQTFTLNNGLKVFVIEDHKIPKISYKMVFDHDPVLEKEYSGYTSMTGQLLGTSTKTKTKDQIDKEIDFIGGKLNFSGSSVSASSLKKHNQTLLELMSDVILNAEFKQDELDKLIKRNLTAYYANLNDPGYIASRVMDVLMFGENHPYGEIITDSTLQNINIEKCRDYYQTFFKPNNAYLAIIGDTDIKKAKKEIKKYFGDWKEGTIPSYEYPAPKYPEKVNVAIVDRPNAVQSVIRIGYPVDYKVGSDDYIKAKLTNIILGGGPYRLFLNLRETHGYTYGAYSKLVAQKLSGIFEVSTDVRNNVTDSAITEIIYEIERLTTEKITEDELQLVKNNLSGNFALALESPATIAKFAFNIERYGLPEDYYVNYLKKIEAVTIEDIHQMAKKYFHPDNLYILVVGNAEEVADKIKKFSPTETVTYYDKDGNSIK